MTKCKEYRFWLCASSLDTVWYSMTSLFHSGNRKEVLTQFMIPGYHRMRHRLLGLKTVIPSQAAVCRHAPLCATGIEIPRGQPNQLLDLKGAWEYWSACMYYLLGQISSSLWTTWSFTFFFDFCLFGLFYGRLLPRVARSSKLGISLPQTLRQSSSSACVKALALSRPSPAIYEENTNSSRVNLSCIDRRLCGWKVTVSPRRWDQCRPNLLIDNTHAFMSSEAGLLACVLRFSVFFFIFPDFFRFL